MKDHLVIISVQAQELWSAGVKFVRWDTGRRLDVSTYVVGVADIDDSDLGESESWTEARVVWETRWRAETVMGTKVVVEPQNNASNPSETTARIPPTSEQELRQYTNSLQKIMDDYNLKGMLPPRQHESHYSCARKL